MTNSQATTEKLIEIDDLVFDHVENIRLSAVTRMEYRKLVIALTREWEYDEVADWVESVDERIHNKLMTDRPVLIDGKLMLDIGGLGIDQPDSEDITNTNGLQTVA